MRMIRRKTIGEQDRVERSIRDHINIIEALEARDTERAEDLVRNHALGLAEHVAKYADYLDDCAIMPHFFCKLIAPRRRSRST
jgi:DNA-binding GntR family transcriptional regulator